MSESSSSSGSGSGPYTIEIPNSAEIPIATLLNGFVPIEPGDEPPAVPDGGGNWVGKLVIYGLEAVEIWVLKRLGALIIQIEIGQ